MDANSKKAMHFIGLIKQYQELTVTARDADQFWEGEQKFFGGTGKEI